MNRFKYIILCLISFLFVAILQVNIVAKIQFFSVSANIFIIYLVYINILNDDKITNIVLSTITGLLYDICFSTIIGIYSILGLIISIVTPILCKRMSVETRLGIMLYVFISTFFFETIYGMIYLFLSGATFILFNYILTILLTSIINMIITMFIHPIFSNYIRAKEEENKIIRRY